MTKQRNFPIGAADAAQPGYPDTTLLSAASAIATLLESVAEATGRQRGRSLHHRRTCTVVQNGTLVSQYVGSFPARDMANELSNETQAGIMGQIFRPRDAGRWEPSR